MSPLPKPCLHPGCPSLTTRKRCPRHEKQYQAERNRRPERQAYNDPAYKAIQKKWQCEKCGAWTDLTKDHITPLSKGGTNEPTNIMTLCRSCNSSKGNKDG